MRWPSRIRHERAAVLRWPVESLCERNAATREEKLFNQAAVATRYPVRAIRYWWTYCAIMDEVRRNDRPLDIVDAGCGQGISRRFVGDIPNTRWTGLDWQVDEEAFRSRGYDQLHECDLDRQLPLDDDCTDVVIFMHVLEHLPRPAFTLQELARILRPGGVLVAGSPTNPGIISPVRNLRYRIAQAVKTRSKGAHITALDPGKWRSLLDEAGLEVETLSGSHLLRWSGSPLENYGWWLRANLLWGRLFPGLGLDLYVVARK